MEMGEKREWVLDKVREQIEANPNMVLVGEKVSHGAWPEIFQVRRGRNYPPDIAEDVKLFLGLVHPEYSMTQLNIALGALLDLPDEDEDVLIVKWHRNLYDSKSIRPGYIRIREPIGRRIEVAGVEIFDERLRKTVPDLCGISRRYDGIAFTEVLREIEVFLFPSVEIARGVLREKIPSGYWFWERDDRYPSIKEVISCMLD